MIAATLRLLLREVREFKHTLRNGIDTYRTAHGMPPLYAEADPEPESSNPNPLIGQGDFLTAWMLEELAHDYNVKVGPDTDLEALARERGWVDPDGKFLLLPQACRGMTSDDTEILSLLSPKVWH